MHNWLLVCYSVPLRRLHELANPWKRFKSSRDILNQCFTEFLSHPFPCRVAWCPASARPCLVSRLCEAVFGVPPLGGHVVPLMQIPREPLLHKSKGVVKFCDILSIPCTRGLCLLVFPLSRG